MRVLAICDPGGVSEFYRVGVPYDRLEKAGYIDLTQDAGDTPSLIDHLHKFDAVVFSRPDSPEHSLILSYAKRAGLRVIVDIDDNLFLIPPSIGVYDAWHQRGTGKLMSRAYYLKRNIKEADVLTVSTWALGRQLCNGQPHSLRERNNFLVLQNQIIAADWTSLPPDLPEGMEKAEGEIWIGWWGIYNHWDDWRDIAPYIEPEIVKRPHVKLLLLGMPELAHLFPALRKSGQLMTGEFIKPGQLPGYRHLVANFDIALAPTADCPFNESKSDLKVLQYGAAGVPVIASSVTYSGWTGLVALCDHPLQWPVHLVDILEHPGLARERAMKLQQQVLNGRSYEANFTQWLAALGLEDQPALEVGISEVMCA